MEGLESPDSQQGVYSRRAGIPLRSFSMAATRPERPTGGRGRALWTQLPSTPLLFVSTTASPSTEGPEVPPHTALRLWRAFILFVEIATSVHTIPSILLNLSFFPRK